MNKNCRICQKPKNISEFYIQPNSMKQKVNPHMVYRQECKRCTNRESVKRNRRKRRLLKCLQQNKPGNHFDPVTVIAPIPNNVVPNRLGWWARLVVLVTGRVPE